MAYVFRSNTQIGNLDAETDVFLNECFLKTLPYSVLSNFNCADSDFIKRIIVGRTGSGKTALLKKVTEADNVYKFDIIEAEKTIFEHISNDRFISNLVKNGVDLQIFFKALWVHVILVKIIDLSIEGKNGVNFLDIFQSESKISDKQKLEKARKYLEDYKYKFFDETVLTEITKNFVSSCETSLGVKGLTNIEAEISSEDKKKIQVETSNYVSRELLQSQKSIMKFLAEISIADEQKKIFINIDDLDKSWIKNDSVHYDFIRALLEAFKELLDIKSVKVLISIRTDILEGVYKNSKNSITQEEKYKSLISPIEWTLEEIREMLDIRIGHLLKNQYVKSDNPKLSNVFDFCIGGVDADEYILTRTMMRPRDAIDLVNSCFQRANGSTKITENHLIEAEEEFYSSRKKGLEDEWMRLYPDIKVYIDSVSFIKEQQFTVDKIGEKYLSSIKNYIISNTEYETEDVCKLFVEDKDGEAINKLVSIYFQIGLLGLVKKGVPIYSSFRKRDLDITNYNDSFMIHPLFYRY